jgi:NADH dehydrogenase [ubiquinone] 1 alpha subcomplex assembly factor 7
MIPETRLVSAHTSPLREIILRSAAVEPLTLAAYMQLALQHPEFGYYRRRDPLGGAGDFITAPEISQMFGEIIGLWFLQQWQALGKPSEFVLLELGPGRGTLLKDALRAIRSNPACLAACRLYLYESNRDLRATQSATLAAHTPRWLEDLNELPPLPTLIISNEFFDALPIRQWRRRGQAWYERRVATKGEQLAWIETAAPLMTADVASDTFPENGFLEISLAAQAMFALCVKHLTTSGGAMLAIDYGYEKPTGQPTFQALHRHSSVDPLADPGNADLTAHVDFGALTRIAADNGCDQIQLRSQSDFLTAHGILMRAEALAAKAAPAQREALHSALHRLLHADEMGLLFKVLEVISPNAASRCD